MKNKNLETIYGKRYSKLGFSFVEVIIVILIISLISVIGVSINNNYTEKTKNSKITSDILTIKNSLESYKNENNILPFPKGNQKYYDNSANYVHYDDPNAFGVYGNITEDTIPKKYMDYTPLDPRTNQYYAYGKTITGNIYYELAGVNIINSKFESKVVGNYRGEDGPFNLIREYNGPDFVYDKSQNNFPYNPDEKIIKGKIGSYKGVVKVNGKNIDNLWIKNNELKAGDVIEVDIGGEAQIYYSDGSKSYLGDSTKASKLTLANMLYKDQNNLFTKIQLVLDYGNILTKTSKLDPNSEFEIYTADTEAAVRGTIFGLTKSPTTTDVIVIQGKVELTKLATTTSDSLIQDLKDGNESQSTPTYSTSPETNLYQQTDGTITIYSNPTNSTPTKATIGVGTSVEISSFTNTKAYIDDDGLTNIQPKIKSINAGEVVLEFPTSFSGTANNKKVMKNGNELINDYYTYNGNLLILYSSIIEQNYTINVCKENEICTKPIQINKLLSYNSNEPTGGCTGDEILFSGDYNDCVDQDDTLVASGFTLVAYAPYDVPGDLNMYYNTGASSLVATNSGIKLPNYPNTYDFISGASLMCNYSDIPNSICNIGTQTGIFIDNLSNDFIKYGSLSPLGINSDFAIEINVKGSALKRIIGTSQNFYLFSTDKYQLLTYNPSSNSIRLKDLSSAKHITKILDSDYGVTNINNDNFYSIIFKKTANIGILSLNGYSYDNTLFNVSSQIGTNLYIGNLNGINYQWNDVINYVKIYKYN